MSRQCCSVGDGESLGQRDLKDLSGLKLQILSSLGPTDKMRRVRFDLMVGTNRRSLGPQSL